MEPMDSLIDRRVFYKVAATGVAGYFLSPQNMCAQIGYSGWLVVEQDVLPDPAQPNQPATDQRRNREYLRRHGL